MAPPPSKTGDGPETDAPVANPTYIGTDRAERQHGGGGPGGGNPPDVTDNRLSHLELRMGGVEGKLDTIIDRLGGFPTRPDMRNYLLLAVGLFVAVAGMLIAGMGWLETRAARVQPAQQAAAPAPQPIVIQVPYPAGAAQPVAPEQNSN